MKYLFNWTTIWFVLYSFLFGTACTPKSKNAEVKVKDIYGCCAPEITDKSWYTSGKKAPLFSGLGGISFPITTKNPEAQKYFNQGFMLSYGFNHAEAARSFFEATRLDPGCAMCWWGYAYVLGPNYNAGMEPDNFKRAYDAAVKARSLSGKCTPVEKALIRALQSRYSADTLAERPPLDSAYAVAMKKVYEQFPDDVNIGALYAESMMDLHPWNLWQKDGTVQPWTPPIVAVLEKCLKIEPQHPGANHFYIHAMEMSQNAGAAMPSADLLMTLVPGSGHLLHMPSHTYIRTGMYHKGTLANLNAVKVDSAYTVACHAQGVYPLAYFPHNYHFIAACATLAGESKTAMMGALETSAHSHKKLMKDPLWATLQHYYCIPMFTMVKLGLWKDIRDTKEPEKVLVYPRIIWHYSQAMASLSDNKTDRAETHLKSIRTLMKDTILSQLTIWGINSILDICRIAETVVAGEIQGKKGNYPVAVQLLKKAVQLEDALNYDEPPDWFFSVRHHLGAVMVSAKQYKEAIVVYEEDLKNYPNNGWALRGLMNVWKGTGDTKKYRETEQQFKEAWKHADIQITSSRIL